MEKIRQTTPLGGLQPSPTQDSGPTYMSRSGGKSKRGGGPSSLPPSNRAKYGLAEGQDVVHMSRSGGSSAGGAKFSLTHEGPARMPRKDKGSASHDSTTFGIAGVTGSGGSGYGVGGV